MPLWTVWYRKSLRRVNGRMVCRWRRGGCYDTGAEARDAAGRLTKYNYVRVMARGKSLNRKGQAL